VARALSENKPFRASSHTAVEKQLGDLLADRKLQSCAGLPICVAGAPEYALCVCSQQLDAFDEEEMRHLVQLANDAGFATESLRNREHLKQSRESLAEAQRIARLGTWRYQLDTGSFQWSSETYRIHAWPRESPLSLGALESLVYPEDRPRVVAAVHTLLREAGSMEIEYRLLLPNQEVRHLHVCAKALSDDDRQVFALTGTVLDVTDQKGRDDKDRAIEKMLVSFLDNLPAVVTLKDEHLEHVYGNTAALDVFHMKSEQFVGTTDTTFLTRDTADLLHVVERSVLNTRQPVLTPEIPLGTNGERRTLRGLCFPVLLPGGRILVGMYASDITELQTVTAKTGLLESALEAAANGVVITDKGGVIEWVNSAFSRITGYSAEEVIGHTPRILKSGRHDAKFYKTIWATLLKGEVWTGDIVNQRKDGTLYDEQMTITPVRDSGGGIAHFIAIKSDITEQKALEDKLLRSQRMESIGLLAGGVAHDLNNILAPILMGAELLHSNELPAKDRDELLDGISRSCERGSGIIRQVLTFARGVEGERVVVQLRHQVKEIVKMARETFPKKIQIGMDVTNAFWTVIGDPTQLHQILLNFSVNARDAMPQGGRLEFIGENVELEEPHSFQGFEIQPGRYARLTVRDTGAGMPPEVLDRIFEPFFTTKEQGKGTGLGLPTVLGIVKSHRGLTEFHSAPGKGTSAILWLPAADSQEEAKNKVQSTPPTGANETILLVDDEEQIRSVTSKLLERANYQVITAEDGASAVAQFATNMDKIALIITDVMMPVMDGVALARSLRKINPAVKIIGSSGFSGDGGSGDRIEELRSVGVKTLLRKPYTSRQLLETVAEELRQVGSASK
jgi:two-component system cell cycle sensor histidine kinase/response regulator CckA